MRLRYSPTSPFVRKISVAALELGLAERITRVPTNPWDPASDIAHDNPLGRIPALVLDDGSGTVLYDSPVIVEYLDALAGGGRLLPAAGPARWA
ncbi:glutathione S-transferase N-terminal domain-containing protein, partial [Plasticicumulans sp.]